MKSDAEILKSFRVELTEDGIVYTVFLIPFPDSKDGLRQAELYRDAVFAAIETVPGDGLLDAIVDLRPIEHINIAPPAGAGKVYKETASHPRVSKVALVGLRPFYKTFAKFVFMAAHKGGSIKAFDTKEGALEWLRES